MLTISNTSAVHPSRGWSLSGVRLKALNNSMMITAAPSCSVKYFVRLLNENGASKVVTCIESILWLSWTLNLGVE
ncbi:unnamed protein product [Calypogeia fissa]